ncbi:MAG: hypothetical protein ACRDPT_12370 [Streptomycetales bacterium]
MRLSTYRGLRPRRRQFWCVHRANQVLVIDLQTPERLVLQVAAPWRTARDIESARARV